MAQFNDYDYDGEGDGGNISHAPPRKIIHING